MASENPHETEALTLDKNGPSLAEYLKTRGLVGVGVDVTRTSAQISFALTVGSIRTILWTTKFGCELSMEMLKIMAESATDKIGNILMPKEN